MSYQRRPSLVRLVHKVEATPGYGPAMQRLRQIFSESVNLPPGRKATALQPSLSPHKELSGSPWDNQLSLFTRKAEYVCRTLGSWGAEYFILESIKMLKKLSSENHELFFLWTSDERSRLLSLLGQDAIFIKLEKERDTLQILVSDKVDTLLTFLRTQDLSGSKILVFVEQRATASILSMLLSKHPAVAGNFRSAPFVGLSSTSKRKYGMPELLQLKTQARSLADFRNDGKNVIVATNALEEGIDVQSCNVVVCFDLPQNIRSFIQRRGRARAADSVYALMFEELECHSRLSEWEELERQLQLAYSDASRERVQRNMQDTHDDGSDYLLHALSTGAKLTANEAMAHLHHFCQSLPAEPYTDMRPTFHFTNTALRSKSVKAIVTLPSCIDPKLRRAQSARGWDTERAAAVDAAFQCYKSLFEAGLLNSNLLPLTHDFDLGLPSMDHLGATVEVGPEFNCWNCVSEHWSDSSLRAINTNFYFLGSSRSDHASMIITLPCEPPQSLSTLRAYWDPETTVDIIFSRRSEEATSYSEKLQFMRRITRVISRSTHSDYSTDQREDFLVLFTPPLEPSALSWWLDTNVGRLPLSGASTGTSTSLEAGFLRNSKYGGRPELFLGWTAHDFQRHSSEEVPTSVPLTRRRNFTMRLDRRKQTPKDEGSTFDHYRASDCTIDRLPAKIGRLNLLLPLVLQHFQDSWTVELLLNTILEGIPCTDSRLILIAVTPPILQLSQNYEALEFLGDSVVKLVVSFQLYEQHPTWPEGYLTRKRALLVSNEFLANAALAIGLARFIRTHPNPWKKWRPIYMSDLDKEPTALRTMRTKVLADVVEALVGALFLDGGLEVARLGIAKLVPSMGLSPPTFTTRLPCDWEGKETKHIETITGHSFRATHLLVEALTHPSFEGEPSVQSYQRLEFLGDAVLDAIIASHLMEQNRERSPGSMTRIKAAIVNGHLLGFFCLDFAHTIQSQSVKETSRGRFEVIKQSQTVHLWQLIRCNHEVIHKRCEAATKRLDELGPAIRQQMSSGSVYPWVGLTTLNPEKFFSDIVESLLGAIYVDSRGSMTECVAFLERIGIMAYFRRLVEDDVDVVHPRTRLDWRTGADTVDYQTTLIQETKKYACSVRIDEKPFVQVTGHEFPEEAVVTAAHNALIKLQNNFGTQQHHSL